MGDIVPDSSKQLSLFNNKDPFKTRDVMYAIDYINEKWEEIKSD